ncbi:hypothetical protein HDU86_004786 [Geranomyces michiganensis]|nr:hypothetical protein HDU86_004786 [Geranomyces michiganensis]
MIDVEGTAHLDVESEPDTPTSPPSVAGFEKAMEAIHQAHRDMDPSTSLFWNILDFRPVGILPMADNPRISSFVDEGEDSVVCLVRSRIEKLVVAAQESLSESVENYFSAVEAVALHLDPTLSIK